VTCVCVCVCVRVRVWGGVCVCARMCGVCVRACVCVIISCTLCINEFYNITFHSLSFFTYAFENFFSDYVFVPSKDPEFTFHVLQAGQTN
jgi:hypothetical protein